MKKLLMSLMSIGIVASTSSMVVSCRTVHPDINYGVKSIKVSNPDTKDNVHVSFNFFTTVKDTSTVEELTSGYTIRNSIQQSDEASNLMDRRVFEIDNLKISLYVSSDKDKLGKKRKDGSAKNIVIALKFAFDTKVVTRSITWNFDICELTSDHQYYNLVDRFAADMPGSNHAGN